MTSSAEVTLRVLSYNVRSLRDDADAVGRVIRAADADLVCVQEAPRFLRWRAKCASIARRGGLVVVTGGRSAAGNLLLAHLRVTVERSEEILLSKTPRLHQRGAAAVVVSVGGFRLTVVGTHLDLDPSERLRHAGELLEALRRFDAPLVLAGDINETADNACFRALANGRQDAFAAAGNGDGHTFSATRPQRRIDAIFVDPAFTVHSCEVLDSPDVRRASDHRPVLAELRLAAS